MAVQAKIIACKISVHGLVQGVGFRPFVHQLALCNGLKGTVNNNQGVEIIVDGHKESINYFLKQLKNQAPGIARIESIKTERIDPIGFLDFKIIQSTNLSNEITQVSPDIAVCINCLSDRKKQPHRLDYAFINCTHCGPRFSILSEIPYDRKNTTMREFAVLRQIWG